jgi:hypothetical protein
MTCGQTGNRLVAIGQSEKSQGEARSIAAERSDEFFMGTAMTTNYRAGAVVTHDSDFWPAASGRLTVGRCGDAA